MATMITKECGICIEKYNKSKLKQITCNYCQYSACRNCVEYYLLNIIEDPHCMNCKKVWNKSFLDSILTKSFINKQLKNHRENILFEREKSLLPATQPAVERYVRLNKMKEEIKELKTLISELQNQLYIKNNEYYDYINSNSNSEFKKDKDKDKAKFIKNCPVQDCRGFLSTQWKCGLCETYSCSKCHEIKGKSSNEIDEHKCNPENIETAKLLAKETKPCPKCGTNIFKIIGCDQMWCTQCHTPFSWNTRRIVTGVIHNPHYYEWKRDVENVQIPRVPGDNPCGGLPHYINLRDYLRSIKNISINKKKYISSIHREISHVENYEMPRLANDFLPEDNQDLRIQYMIKNIDETKFKKRIQIREKKRKKELEMRKIYEMYVITGSEMMRNILTLHDSELIDAIIEQYNALKDYTNNELYVVSKRYSSKSYYKIE